MPLLTDPTVPPGGPGHVLSLPFPLVNSGTSPLLGTVLGTEVGMEMLEVKLLGQGVFKEEANSPPALLLCPGGHSVGLVLPLLTITAVPPCLSLPFLPGPGKVLPPRHSTRRLGATDNDDVDHLSPCILEAGAFPTLAPARP